MIAQSTVITQLPIPESQQNSLTSSDFTLCSQEKVNKPHLVADYASQQSVTETEDNMSEDQPQQIQPQLVKAKRTPHSSNENKEVSKKLTKTSNQFDALSTQPEVQNAMETESLASNSSDQFDFDSEDLPVPLPITTLQAILNEALYKKSEKVIRAIVVQYTEDFKNLVSDFKILRHVLESSSNPTNTCHRIDRLLPKLLKLNAYIKLTKVYFLSLSIFNIFHLIFILFF